MQNAQFGKLLVNLPALDAQYSKLYNNKKLIITCQQLQSMTRFLRSSCCRCFQHMTRSNTSDQDSNLNPEASVFIPEPLPQGTPHRQRLDSDPLEQSDLSLIKHWVTQIASEVTETKSLQQYILSIVEGCVTHQEVRIRRLDKAVGHPQNDQPSLAHLLCALQRKCTEIETALSKVHTAVKDLSVTQHLPPALRAPTHCNKWTASLSPASRARWEHNPCAVNSLSVLPSTSGLATTNSWCTCGAEISTIAYNQVFGQ